MLPALDKARNGALPTSDPAEFVCSAMVAAVKDEFDPL